MAALPSLSSGLKALDNALVGRGLVPGSIVHLYGENASAKTALCLHYCRSIQEMGEPAWWVATEPPPTSAALDWASVNSEAFFVIQQTPDLLGMEAVTAVICNGAKLVVLDSVAALLGEMEEQQIPAILLSHLPSLKEKLVETGGILILTDQLRTALPTRQQLPTGMGTAVMNYCDYRIHLTVTDSVVKAGTHVGCRIHFKVVKNQLEFDKWGVTGKFTCFFEEGLEDMRNVKEAPE